MDTTKENQRPSEVAATLANDDIDTLERDKCIAETVHRDPSYEPTIKLPPANDTAPAQIPGWPYRVVLELGIAKLPQTEDKAFHYLEDDTVNLLVWQYTLRVEATRIYYRHSANP